MSENLPDVKRDSILLRIKKIFSKLIFKEEKEVTYVNKEKVINKKANFFEEERERSRRYNYLLDLQKKFEDGEILESEIKVNDLEELQKIYIEQINMLKAKIKSIECQL